MIDTTLLKSIYTNEEYINHADEFNNNPEDIELRFRAWVVENKIQLKFMYRDLFDDDDIDILQTPYFEWARQTFICWDYNIIQQASIKNLVEEMLNGN